MIDKDFQFKSWRDVTDSKVALQKLRDQVEDEFNRLRWARIPLPAVIQEDIASGLKSPHLTVEGVQNILGSLRSFESNF